MDSDQQQRHPAQTSRALRALEGHLDARGDAELSEAVLMAAGREWGRRDERTGVEDRSATREHLLEGLESLAEFGLAAVVLEEFRFTPSQPGSSSPARCRVVCRFSPAAGGGVDGGERVRHLLAAGYLTGWIASLTGLEVNCGLHPRTPWVAPGDSDTSVPGAIGAAAALCTIETLAPNGGDRGALAREPDFSKGDLRGLGIELQDLVEMTLDTIVFLDSAGIVRYWNRGATHMFGYQPEEVLGRNIRFLIPRDLLQDGELEELKAECKAEGVALNHTTRRLHKDGSTLWVSLTRTVSRDHQGREVGVVATMRDITEQRRRDRELQRSRALAMVGELAAKVAHEVKNPLAGIYAALQVLEGHLHPTDPHREIFDSIGEEVMRLNAITQELLNFARPPEPTLSKVDLRRFLAGLVDDLERLSMAEAGEIELEGLERGLVLNLDTTLTGQVFKNLILNGLQANGGHGPIRLSSQRHGDRLAVDVADSGPGIPKESRDSIFEPFFTTKSRGTGLGLSIARKNIEAQGGTIRLRGHLGKGAIFRIELPIVS